MLVIHELGMNLDRGEKLLVNSDPDQPISSLCAPIKYPRCCPVMHSLLPRFIKVGMCLEPFVPYLDTFFIPRRHKGPENMSICVFECRYETYRALRRSVYLIDWMSLF